MKINNSTLNTNNENQVICRLSNCNKLIEKQRIVQHIGRHIVNNETVQNANLCGFWGKVGCKIDVVTTSGYGTAKVKGPYSNCVNFYSFKLLPASKSSKRSPCTNRPFTKKIRIHKKIYTRSIFHHLFPLQKRNVS